MSANDICFSSEGSTPSTVEAYFSSAYKKCGKLPIKGTPKEFI